MSGASNNRVANGLVSLSSAAVLVVYAAGFMKTRAAAERLEDASNERRPPMPSPATAGETRTPSRIEPPAGPVANVAGLKSPVMPKAEAHAPAPAPKAAASKAAATTTKPVTSVTSAKPANASSATAPLTPAEPAPSAATTLPPTAATTSEPNPTNPTNPTNPSNLVLPKEKYKDGTFLGWGTCRHGDIQASVTIENGRITAASIAQCWTRYSCSWVAHLPPQVVARQSADVDYVSGATQSANAFYWAIIDALTKAK